MKSEERLTEKIWQAIIHNDARYDGIFIYAVKSTNIFCKPSCKSKVPKKENVRIFQNPQKAQAANFRPCKRCTPTSMRLPDQEWVDQISKYIYISVGCQKHCPIKSRVDRGFLFLWDQVLVIGRCQELDPIPNGCQEH